MDSFHHPARNHAPWNARDDFAAKLYSGCTYGRANQRASIAARAEYGGRTRPLEQGSYAFRRRHPAHDPHNRVFASGKSCGDILMPAGIRADHYGGAASQQLLLLD